ncbi:MAG TPA: APC family permease [Victivallales bacterium]|nr:APC family permease [Victivallales bacterium]
MNNVQKPQKIGLFSVIAISVSGIIGSGWMFSAYLGAKEAGSAVYFSWTLALIFFLLMALVISEIVAMYPVRGVVGRLGVISHNKYFGAIFSFAIWLDFIGGIPAEAQATVEYMSSLSPSISNHLMYDGSLTFLGICLTLVILIIYWVINMFGIKFFAKINNVIVVYKFIIPVFVGIIIIIFCFQIDNFSAFHHSFMPYGANSIFMAITASGMIYAFNGFQLGTSFASEVKNPAKTLPAGMILSIIICFIIYILLQTAFIGALNTKELASTGWHALNFDSPFVKLTSLLGLNFVTLMLYVDACISPSGTGIAFVGGTSRVLCGMAREKQMPKIFSKVNKKYNFSSASMLFNFIIAVCFLFLFHSWANIILFLTSLIILLYMIVPISLVGLRRALPNKKRTYKLPCAFTFCTILFIIQSLFFVFVGAKDMLYLTVAITIFMIIFISLNGAKNSEYKLKDIIYTCLPFIIFLWILTALICIGPITYGGCGILNTYTLFISIGVLSFITFTYVTSSNFVNKCRVIKDSMEPVDLTDETAIEM